MLQDLSLNKGLFVASIVARLQIVRNAEWMRRSSNVMNLRDNTNTFPLRFYRGQLCSSSRIFQFQLFYLWRKSDVSVKKESSSFQSLISNGRCLDGVWNARYSHPFASRLHQRDSRITFIKTLYSLITLAYRLNRVTKQVGRNETRLR